VRFPFFRQPSTSTATAPTGEADDSLIRWTLALYLCIAVTMSAVMGMAIWGVIHDLEQVRITFIKSEIERLRSHAERTVMRLQGVLPREFPNGLDDKFRDESFVRDHWDTWIKTDESRLYAAIVDGSGRVFMNSQRKLEGEQLPTVWYDEVVREAGDDVVDTIAPALTGGVRALDVRVPIVWDNKTLGTYHSGMTFTWMEQRVAELQQPIRRLWTWIIVGILAAMITAGGCMYQIGRRIAVLREAMKLARIRRFAEVGQLMAGIVHEIRNPLNAMRLNLHVLDRYFSRLSSREESHDGDEITAVDQSEILQETNREIARVEGLMRVLLGYARPDQLHPEYLDLRQEVESALLLMRPALERGEIIVKAQFADQQLLVLFDRDRLRQILLNLINNAKEATGPGGLVQITVKPARSGLEITVADDGPGVPRANRERIFEPFFSTKDSGTGLGLALVRRYIEEVGGAIDYEPNEPRGALFRLRFPSASTVLRQDANLSSAP
jgi:signal transduction histidine kinase